VTEIFGRDSQVEYRIAVDEHENRMERVTTLQPEARQKHRGCSKEQGKSTSQAILGRG
jgi:hypothetical protein